ncbi:MAG: hypothetical protein KI788_15805 [Mameliella sp.]|nr:hypothetical protein [Mameliella sp.]
MIAVFIAWIGARAGTTPTGGGLVILGIVEMVFWYSLVKGLATGDWS